MAGKTKASNRERNRALAAGVVLAAVCAASLYLANNSTRTTEQYRKARIAASGHGSGSATQTGLPAAGGEGDDNTLTTGSILFVPNEGNVCRRKLIDNRTWLMRDAGNVVCDEAVSWNSNIESQHHSAAARIEAIRGGFSAK